MVICLWLLEEMGIVGLPGTKMITSACHGTVTSLGIVLAWHTPLT